MEEEVASTYSASSGGDGGGDSEQKIDKRLENALIRFQRGDNAQQPIHLLSLYDIRFNCATVNRLTAFLLVCGDGSDHEDGIIVNKNRGHDSDRLLPPVVNELCIDYCKFENTEALCLLCNFFASSKSSNKTALQKIHLRCLRDLQVYKYLLSSLHYYKSITKISLSGDDNAFQGKAGGEMVGNLLLRNKILTALTLKGCRINVKFIRAMGEGLLASRLRLKFLKLHCVKMNNEALNELRLVYSNTKSKGQTYTVLSHLDLSHNDFEGVQGGNHLHGLLLTLPCLKTLNLRGNKDLGPKGACALFSEGIAAVLGRLQSLCIAGCLIENVGIAQMAATMPPDSTALVHLDLQRNDIVYRNNMWYDRNDIVYRNNMWYDHRDDALLRLLPCCPRLETLLLCRNYNLGPEGARIMAPALGHLRSLQDLKMSNCNIRDGATEILTNLGYIPCLKSLNLICNDLPPAILAPLIDYLNGTGRSLEVLNLYGNRNLFGTTNLGQQGGFFASIANHTAIQRLDVRQCGLGCNETDGPLLSAVFKNWSLVTVNGAGAEYMRRDVLMTHIQATMGSPTTIQVSVWPMALGICAPPRFIQVGARPIFCLIQKMAEGDVFVHTASVHRFEKIRSSIRVQRWWRHVVASKALQHCTRSTASP